MPKELTKKRNSPTKAAAPVPEAPVVKPVERKDLIVNPAPSKAILLEVQGPAPSPNNTYYNLVIQEDKVTLNEWPRMRLSQRWTRSGAMNPDTKVISSQDYLNGEWKEEMTFVFGKEMYEKSVKVLESKKAIVA